MTKTINRRSFLGISASGTIGALFVAGCGMGGAAVAAGNFEIRKSPGEWKKQLGPQRFNILREAGTEAPYTSPLNKEHRRGTFACGGCALPNFSSSAKFESGTGWPSFWQPLPKAVAQSTDRSLGVERDEIHCRRCGGHLGHVFNDGPKPTGLRYCMNGLALRFRPA